MPYRIIHRESRYHYRAVHLIGIHFLPTRYVAVKMSDYDALDTYAVARFVDDALLEFLRDLELLHHSRTVIQVRTLQMFHDLLSNEDRSWVLSQESANLELTLSNRERTCSQCGLEASKMVVLHP